MMRDYKIRESDWPRPRDRRKRLRLAAASLAGIAVALLAFVGVQWLLAPPQADDQAVRAKDPSVIPLAIPPTSGTQAPTPPP